MTAKLSRGEATALNLADGKRTRSEVADLMGTSEECVSTHLNHVRKN